MALQTQSQLLPGVSTVLLNFLELFDSKSTDVKSIQLPHEYTYYPVLLLLPSYQFHGNHTQP